MVINQKSWHYALYTFSFAVWGVRPRTTNLCSYVQRVLFVFPITVILVAFLMVMAGLSMALGAIFAPIIGKYPVGFFEFKEYRTINIGFNVYPYHVMLLAGFVIMNYFLIKYHTEKILACILSLEAGVAAVAIALALYIFLSRSEFAKIISAYIAAKKARVCPVIKFTEESKE